MAGRRQQRMLAILGLASIALLVWSVGIVGVGQAGEDICLTRPPAGATGYQGEGSVWPPRMSCVYGTSDGGTLVVDHRLYATAAAAWLVGFPIIAALGIGLVGRRTKRS